MQKKEFIKQVVEEDIGRGDLFARISESSNIRAYIIAKSNGVFGGQEYIEVLAKMYNFSLTWKVEDGSSFKESEKLLYISGDSKILLSLERSILNIVLHASSIATLTSHYVKMLEGTEVKLLDTRKTRPLLREFEKYAVCCGGGLNHRMGLDDCLMLKDTHLKTINDLGIFIQKARKKIPFTSKIEIECENFETAKRAMIAGVEIIMCDNMSLEEITEVVAYRNAHYPHILVEASGNVTLKTIKSIAQTGVDAISSGSIIHQANWIDLSMKVE
ncbi:MAG: carboxylating nicotinate-nucleotide diphosphorylase [Sulfurovum sp.]|nr:carboxylating nicotinate-nucleotide diphosphorylase [Sulfurovum sp.]MCB4744456.1 carboxylating nicotinate-nucleotide diphosphorylase [Sulfurovum sp.]MCB4745916.1 carboxylating nicotinate-nucleotide diphosphorylase [Sulfurovum sp.]MCB4747749.1 carboxylating nicotinate-nucleotide diphosphorylase [Sulfurovum sp.]MCB4748983.1 carboxylating nicotinate-nucleotide diphosphorylase [Sulfurovum sp.]